jgi:hypothetical protein
MEDARKSLDDHNVVSFSGTTTGTLCTLRRNEERGHINAVLVFKKEN